MTMRPEGVRDFFSYARERHRIYLKREREYPSPWTADPILRTYRFTNVFRELDRTTVWFARNIRDGLRNRPECLLATVLFRWFNRIGTGEILFNQGLLGGGTPWERFLETGDTSSAESALRSALPRGPWVTGSYMIRSPTGVDKLSGMLQLCRRFYRDSEWRTMARDMLSERLDNSLSMRSLTGWLQELPGMGPFLAYEVACDLQHTDLMNLAPDVMTWANLGPGARRGINRVRDLRNPGVSERQRRPKHTWSWPARTDEEYLEDMQELLQESRDSANWPSDWQQWDMRTVEHTLCEFDKYSRVLRGEGVPRQLFRDSVS